MAIQNQVQMGFDKDGKLSPSLNDPNAFVKNWFSLVCASTAGAASGINELLVQLEVEAGTVLQIWNIFANYYSSASLAGKLVFCTDTTAAIAAGTKVTLMTLGFEPAKAAGPLGTTVHKHLKGEKAPLFIVDNKSGTASIYLTVYIPTLVALALTAQAATQAYELALNGVKYT